MVMDPKAIPPAVFQKWARGKNTMTNRAAHI